MTRASKKLIVITGVTRGLGLAMTEKLVQLGHTVVGCGRSHSEIDKLRKSFLEPNSFDILDVSNDAAVKAWADRVLDQHGAPDLLLNNAAIMNPIAPLWQVPVHDFDRLVDINLKGVANVIRHFVPAMIEWRKGVIVNFSSGWGRSTSPEVAPYCASKWAIEGLSQALAQELPEGLACVALNPGIIDTPMLRSSWGEGASKYPSARDWSERAIPFILQLGPKDNGKQLTVPGARET